MLSTHTFARLTIKIIFSGNGEGMFSTLRRLSTVSRKTRSKKKLFDLDKDIEVISEQESGTDTGTSGFVRYCIAFW